jgi:hypothetical protein
VLPTPSVPGAPDEAERAKREQQVQQVVSGLKSVADLLDSSRDRKAVAERVGARLLTSGVQHLEQPGVQKQAARPAGTALGLAVRAERELGPVWVQYEPETLMESLGLTAHETTSLLFARQTLYDPDVFEHWHMFEKAAVAFNGRPVDFTLTQELDPHEIAWAHRLMRVIDRLTPLSEEVKAYIAVQLHRAGLVCCPHELADCQPALDHLSSDVGRVVAHQVRKQLPSPAADVQRSRLAAIDAHVDHLHHELLKEIAP